MQDLFLLSEEFGFSGLLSQVTDFISAHSVADSEAWKRISDLEAKNRQQDRELCLLQKEVVDLRGAQMQNIAEIREGRSREAAESSRLAELSHLAGENASLGCAQEKSDKEIGELCAQFAQEQTNHVRERESMKLEMVELREAQKPEIAAVRDEATEWGRVLCEQLAIVK
jgi:predicted RNase H-like nuclease (RuvC/YqgF family)